MPKSIENIKLGSSTESQRILTLPDTHTLHTSALGYYLWSRNGVRKTTADPAEFSTQSRLWTRPF